MRCHLSLIVPDIDFDVLASNLSIILHLPAPLWPIMPSTLPCSTENVTSLRALNGARSSTGWLVSRRHRSMVEHGGFQALQLAELVFFGNVVDFDDGHLLAISG